MSLPVEARMFNPIAKLDNKKSHSNRLTSAVKTIVNLGVILSCIILVSLGSRRGKIVGYGVLAVALLVTIKKIYQLFANKNNSTKKTEVLEQKKESLLPNYNLELIVKKIPKDNSLTLKQFVSKALPQLLEGQESWSPEQKSEVIQVIKEKKFFILTQLEGTFRGEYTARTPLPQTVNIFDTFILDNTPASVEAKKEPEEIPNFLINKKTEQPHPTEPALESYDFLSILQNIREDNQCCIPEAFVSNALPQLLQGQESWCPEQKRKAIQAIKQNRDTILKELVDKFHGKPINRKLQPSIINAFNVFIKNEESDLIDQLITIDLQKMNIEKLKEKLECLAGVLNQSLSLSEENCSSLEESICTWITTSYQASARAQILQDELSEVLIRISPELYRKLRIKIAASILETLIENSANGNRPSGEELSTSFSALVKIFEKSQTYEVLVLKEAEIGNILEKCDKVIMNIYYDPANPNSNVKVYLIDHLKQVEESLEKIAQIEPALTIKLYIDMDISNDEVIAKLRAQGWG